MKNIKVDNKIFGLIGEKIAVEYLEKCGYKILEKNYKTLLGEIDIICLDNTNKCNPIYIFVEVKYRSSTKFGFPREAITQTKQNRIKKTATYYLMQKGLYEKVLMRFDCIEILDGVNGKEPVINLINNAF